MDVNVLLATIVLASFVVTVVLAVGSYVAYKIRERQRPRAHAAPTGEPVYFERFYGPPARRDATGEEGRGEPGAR